MKNFFKKVVLNLMVLGLLFSFKGNVFACQSAMECGTPPIPGTYVNCVNNICYYSSSDMCSDSSQCGGGICDTGNHTCNYTYYADDAYDSGGVNIGSAFKIKGNQGIAGATGYNNIGIFVSTSIIPNVMVIANVILFFLIIGAGFTIVSSAGNADKQKQASATLTYSILGFVIIFAAYWIMQMLGIITGFNLVQ